MKSLSEITLERSTQGFIDQLKASNAPPIYTLSPREARKTLEKVQSETVESNDVSFEEHEFPAGPNSKVSVTIIKPKQAKEALPGLVFMHGAGWVMGGLSTHKRLASEIAFHAHVAVIFVNYSLSPEAKFPTAIEEGYSTLKYVAENGKKLGIDTTRLCVAGDSVGGNMSIAIAMLAKERKGPKIDKLVLFYPVTDASLSSASYQQFAEGPWLTKAAMEWFWNAYEPDGYQRKQPLASPINARIEQLQGLPATLVITAEYDVLRDEGEGFAHLLMKADVDVTAVRFQGTIHDFVMLNALSDSPASKGAIAFACNYLNQERNAAATYGK